MSRSTFDFRFDQKRKCGNCRNVSVPFKTNSKPLKLQLRRKQSSASGFSESLSSEDSVLLLDPLNNPLLQGLFSGLKGNFLPVTCAGEALDADSPVRSDKAAHYEGGARALPAAEPRGAGRSTGSGGGASWCRWPAAGGGGLRDQPVSIR